MRHTFTVITCLSLSLLLLTACGVQGTLQTEAPSIVSESPSPTINPEAISLIKAAIAKASIDEVSVFCLQEDGKLSVKVHLDPLVLKYQFAQDLEPSLLALKEIINEYGIELSEFEFSSVSYKGGKADNIMVWTSSDLLNGSFVNPGDKIVDKEMSLEDIFEYCEYTSGNDK